ncbi:MAG: phage virion morphogenesis protein [Treponema sp.]|nr:phage virion morphogenesis protein [Candidatus Treponema caballi]
MGVTVVKKVGELSKRLQNGSLEPTMRRLSKYLVSSAERKINSDIPPENAPLTQAVKQGNRTLRDNGTLLSSIAPQNGSNWASANTNLVYARIMQYGGTINGKSKGLWLPASEKTRALYRRYNAQKPSELVSAMKGDGYSFARIKNAFFARRGKEGPFVLFVIKRSVTIPARPFLYIDERDRQYIDREITKALKKVLGEMK